jgi:hypothetical protein
MKYLITLIALVSISVYGEAQDAASRERGRVLIDTNATTTVTLKTATAPGQLLVGKVAGSNAVWIATKSGTNGWVKLAQTAAD